jgi:uncharacterized FlaG/YvyC family protein
MKNNQPSREQLEKRQEELNEQLRRTGQDLRIELDPDPEEQAIQLEQDEVSITMESNLRKELIDVEERLAEMDENK